MMMMIMMMLMTRRIPIKVLVGDSRRAVITTSKVEVAIRRPVQIVRSMDMRSTDMIGRDAI
jgi:hypothetical protein